VFRDRGELARGRRSQRRDRKCAGGVALPIGLCSPQRSSRVEDQWSSPPSSEFGDRCVCAASSAGEPFASALPGREAEGVLPGRKPCARNTIAADDPRRKAAAGDSPAYLQRNTQDAPQVAVKITRGNARHRPSMTSAALTAGRRQRPHQPDRSASLVGMIFTNGLSVTAIQARDAAPIKARERRGYSAFGSAISRTKLESRLTTRTSSTASAQGARYTCKAGHAELSDGA